MLLGIILGAVHVTAKFLLKHNFHGLHRLVIFTRVNKSTIYSCAFLFMLIFDSD